jgi:microcystin-dependent protein
MLKVSPRTVVALVSALAALQAPPAAAQATEPILGQIMCAGFNFTPRGWAELNGQLIPIAQNTAGQGPGLSLRDQGETGGSEANTLTTINMPAHAHGFAPLGSTNDATSVSPAGKVAASKARTTLYADPTNVVAQAASVTSSAGNGVPVNNMQPYLTIRCFIAVEGIFPSRN